MAWIPTLFLLSDMSRIRRKFRRYHRPNPRLNQRNRLCRSHLTQYLPSRFLMHIGHRYQVSNHYRHRCPLRSHGIHLRLYQ